MTDNIMDNIVWDYLGTHELVLNTVEKLNDQQIWWQPNKTTPSIGFNVWHLARWADYLQEAITDNGIQIWITEELAAQWGFDDADLGFAETGMGMDYRISASLPIQRKDDLLEYAYHAFIKADKAVSMIKDDQFHCKIQDRHGFDRKEWTVGEAILALLAHANRHLGMIECLIGVQGMQGTATR